MTSWQNTCVMHFTGPANTNISKPPTIVHKALYYHGVVALEVEVVQCTSFWAHYWYVRFINCPCCLGKSPYVLKSFDNLL